MEEDSLLEWETLLEIWILCRRWLLGSDKRSAPEEQRETGSIAYVQHGTVTAPRYC